jgi:pSer/pThr/pTyr-binding forkhead associated (FHA) protein
VAGEPFQPHGATPVELQQRLEAERRGFPFLVYRDGEGRQVIMALVSGRVAIGRRSSNELALSWDPEVSRLHAALEQIGPDWVLCDEGLSHNGTWVNGTRVQARHRLSSGDVFAVGETLIAFWAPRSNTAEPTRTAQEARAPIDITPAQRRVLVALCRPLLEGRYAAPASNREIADELVLAVDTVKGTLSRLFDSFGLDAVPQHSKRAALARRAIETGVVRRASGDRDG